MTAGALLCAVVLLSTVDMHQAREIVTSEGLLVCCQAENFSQHWCMPRDITCSREFCNTPWSLASHIPDNNAANAVHDDASWRRSWLLLLQKSADVLNCLPKEHGPISWPLPPGILRGLAKSDFESTILQILEKKLLSLLKHMPKVAMSFQNLLEDPTFISGKALIFENCPCQWCSIQRLIRLMHVHQ